MRKTMKKTTSRTWRAAARCALLALAAGLASGCGWWGAEPILLEVRTYELAHLHPDEAAELISPYVYYDRPLGAGAISGIDGAITVRETRDNLDRIARVLAEFDLPRPDMSLHFQLIEADGFADSDPRIAPVEAELRKIFQFRGYRLTGEAYIAATEGSDVQQDLRATDGSYGIRGHVYRVSPGVIRLENISLFSHEGGQSLQTTVTIRPGQTLVLGSAPKQGSTATLLLTVRAEEGPGPA